jgi:hypothetical protein
MLVPFSDVYTFPNINKSTTFIVNIVNTSYQGKPFKISINFELNLFDFKFYEVFNDFFSKSLSKSILNNFIVASPLALCRSAIGFLERELTF